MRVTVPTRTQFGAEASVVGDDLVRPEAWDALRVQTDGPYALPATREAWEARAAAEPAIEARGAALSALLDELGATSVASYGVGAAITELWLHRLAPARPLTITEFAPQTVDRLRALAPEMRVVQHDFSSDGPLDADVHVFNRVDTEMNNRDWRRLLRRYAGVRLVVVSGGIIDKKRIAVLLKAAALRRGTHTGWSRNGPAYEALWRAAHDPRRVDVADLPAWVLEPRA